MSHNVIGETKESMPPPLRPTDSPAEVEDRAARATRESSRDGFQASPPESHGSESREDETPLVEGVDDEQFDDEDEEEIDMDVKPLEEIESVEPRPEEHEKKWYILKVQSNRENSICDALRRQVAIRGLSDYFGDILVPTEDVAEFKNGKRRVVKRKLYPGYIVVNMALTEETWFVVRETPGIGDFTGAAGKPSPMLPEEIEPILRTIYPPEEGTEAIKTAIPFKLGDRVRIKDGTFENFEGEVETIDEANGRVTVIINIFGRSTPVELEHWQIESV
jgi:transcriptional antiterminator NusG